MMLLDEPYRFAEAVANRRDYIEDQLRGGTPVVGTSFDGGAILLTLGTGQQKLHEAYNRIGMGSIGHPTDIEKLRQAAVDLASMVGFNYSDADVTLQQIVHFGLGPAVKAAFDDVIRSPYIARVLLAEVGDPGTPATFYTVDYDGAFERFEKAGAVGPVAPADLLMRERLLADGQDVDLQGALKRCLSAWAVGRWAGTLEESPHDPDEMRKALEGMDTDALLREALSGPTPLKVEAMAVDRGRTVKNKCRALVAEELAPAISEYQTAQPPISPPPRESRGAGEPA